MPVKQRNLSDKLKQMKPATLRLYEGADEEGGEGESSGGACTMAHKLFFDDAGV